MTTPQDLIPRMQTAIAAAGLPAWLFYSFHGNDPIALSILSFDPGVHATRRWFYLVPAAGEPTKLVHRIEPGVLDHLPGEKRVYLRWEELDMELERMLGRFKTVAMQYSSKNSVPYVSRVDAGTVELVRGLGINVVSSADLVQEFEARWTGMQIEQHRETALFLTDIVQDAFERTASLLRSGETTTELDIQRFIMQRFTDLDLVTDSPPIVGVNANSADPHYAPSDTLYSPVRRGDFLLIDLWAKPRVGDSVYADITWTGFLGRNVPDNMVRVFEVVRDARDRGVSFLQESIRSGRLPQGWEVDDAVRAVIRQAGHEEHFVHRTGHNLGREVHGNGVNFDNLETHDTRTVIPGITCTIEPGIYLENFGVRSEINVHMGSDGPEVTTPPQNSLLVFEI